jgi:hypothetical protein
MTKENHMSELFTTDQKTLFAFVPGKDTEDGIPFLVFMVPEAAWDYMEDGHAHDFDLTKVGIPLKVTIGRCRDHAHARQIIAVANAEKAGFQDVTDADLSFTPQTKQ